MDKNDPNKPSFQLYIAAKRLYLEALRKEIDDLKLNGLKKGRKRGMKTILAKGHKRKWKDRKLT